MSAILIPADVVRELPDETIRAALATLGLVLPGLGILRRTHGKLEASGLDEASHG